MTRSDPLDSYWPQAAGSISETATFDSPYRIFKIEDTHYGIDVQKGMLGVLRFLHREYGITLTGLEGAEGDLLIAEIKSVIRPDEVKQLDGLLKTKVLTAPEYLALTSDLPLELYGVEQRNLYDKNQEALKQAAASYDLSKRLFEILKGHVASLKEAVCGPDLLAFERAVADYEAGEISLKTFVLNWLCPYTAERAGIPIDEFPNLALFVAFLALEQVTEYKRVRSETARLLNDVLIILFAPRVEPALFERAVRAQRKLEGRGSAAVADTVDETHVMEYKAFARDVFEQLKGVSQAIKTDQLPTSEMYDLVIELGTFCRLDLRRYPNLLRYAHGLHLAGAIHRKNLLAELLQAIDEVRAAVSTTVEETALTADRVVTGFEKIARLESTPEESEQMIAEFGHLSVKDLLRVAQLSKAMGAFEEADGTTAGCSPQQLEAMIADFQGCENEAAGFQTLVLESDLALEGAYRFYQLAPLRGRAIAENTLRAMREQGVTEAALVTGGFLTSQILGVLNQLQVSYVVIVPPSIPSSVSRDIYIGTFQEEKPGSGLLRELRERALHARAAARSQAD